MVSLDLSEISFDPDITFESGQTFRWKRLERDGKHAWMGVVANRLVKIHSRKVECVATSINNHERKSNFLEEFANYLSLKDDLKSINASFPKDEYLLSAVNQFKGLRVLTQDPWECLISFVCSINKNIPAIKMMIELLSMKFGSKITAGNFPSYTFPEPSALARASKADLLDCKLGFRWKFIRFIAKQVNSGNLDLEPMRKRSYEHARNQLISEISGRTFGVGPKVADCVLLFSMHKTEAFPIDVWMRRCIVSLYAQKMNLPSTFRNKSGLSMRAYELIRKKAYEYFGKNCGYAQQYLYMKIRGDFTRNRAPA